MENRLDILVFGATGFTGKFTLPYLYNLTKNSAPSLTWGVAGRSENKLRGVLAETAKRIGISDLNTVPVIIADVGDQDSVRKMTIQTKLIINCCGPYELYGEVVVKSCIETRTNYVDVSAEPCFIEDMVSRYGKLAEENKVYIVSACGFGYVPVDMGLVFLKNNFEGTLNSAEIYLHGYIEEYIPKRPILNNGTWNSTVKMLENIWKLRSLRNQLSTNQLPPLNPKLNSRFPLRKIENGKWAARMPFLELLIIDRSQRYFYEHNKTRPIQIQYYGVVDTFKIVMKFLFFGVIFILLSQFKFGRNLLCKYPERFSAGIFTKEPSEEGLDSLRFSHTFYGKGWSEKIAESEYQQKSPDKSIVVRISGKNPAYGYTCIVLALCGITMLRESENLPVRGGVYSTAIAFSKTSLIEQLQKNGIIFEILSVQDI